MSRKISVFALIVLTIALILIPSAHAEYPLDNIEVKQDLPGEIVAGSTYEMVILFDNIAKEPVTFYVEIMVTCDDPLGLNEIFVDEVELNWVVLPCVETEPGIFSTPTQTIGAMSRNRLDITISTAINLMPGAYTFDIGLMGEEMEPKPGPTHVIGRPNAEPKADAGPNQKAWVDHIVYFDGSKSEDPDGIIESYEWDFGDDTTASGVSVEHEYSEPGQYTVTLTVRDDRWSYDSDTCKIKISEYVSLVSNKFAERVPSRKRGYIVDALEEANTTVTLETTDNVTVTVLRYEENPYPRDPIPAMALPTYVDVEVSDPDAVVWPIYVEMFYTDDEVMGLDESTFGIYYWMDGAWQRCSDTGVDTVLNVVWAYMTAEEASGSPILIAGMHAIITPPLPPFLDNLAVTPLELELGDNVTVSLDIMNPNDGAIGYGFDMEIGDLTLKIWVDLEAYESKTVSRTITPTEVGTYNVTVIEMTGNFTVKAPPKPSEFVVSDLSITPEEFELGEGIDVWSFRITVDVENVGEQEGTHTVDLKVDGDVIQAGTVILWGGEETMIVFDVTRGVGSYTVEVDGLTGSFTVTAYPKLPEFEVSDLIITPEEIELGDEVTVTFVITNADSRSYVFVPFVQIGDTMIMEDVELEGHESRTVSHTITPESVGDYDVTIDGFEGSFTVKPRPTVTIWMQPGYVAGILIAIVAVGATIYFIWKRKLFPTISSDST